VRRAPSLIDDSSLFSNTLVQSPSRAIPGFAWLLPFTRFFGDVRVVKFDLARIWPLQKQGTITNY